VADAATATLIAVAMSVWIAPASAVVVDPTVTYTVNGSYAEHFDENIITGTLTVDLKTDKVTAANINTGSPSGAGFGGSGGFGTYSTIIYQGGFGRHFFVDLFSASNEPTLFLLLDTRSTLFDGQTTKIDPNSNFFFLSRFESQCFSDDDFTGQLTVLAPVSVAAAVPEPSTWAMIALGLVGVGFVTSRRTKTRMRLA
jgi:hypothetical protein